MLRSVPQQLMPALARCLLAPAAASTAGLASQAQPAPPTGFIELREYAIKPAGGRA
jgi:hypothetical protein